MTKKIKVTLFRWAGKFGPLSVNIPCGECTLTKDILDDTFNNELKDIDIELEIKDWLSVWWQPLMKGAFHAPIVMVEGKIISQGEALNRGVLIQSIIKESVKTNKINETILFGKEGCPYCVKAKDLLDTNNIKYTYKNVVKDSAALYKMIPSVKAYIGGKTPVTVPQIWIDGDYIGGYDELNDFFKK